MKIININVNGIRSAAKKNFFAWAFDQQPDLICLQEVRAPASVINNPLFHLDGYTIYSFEAQKNGYSGVTVYAKKQPKNIIKGLGWPSADNEGRYLQLDFEHFKIANIYLPSGGSSETRQIVKYDFLENYQKILAQQIAEPLPYIICGDFNIAHNNIDIKNWRANQKCSGFLPAERAWLDLIFNNLGFIDVYRFKNPDKAEYTWWSNFGNAWHNNVGWRIDYQIVSPQLKDKIISTAIYRKEKFSDHAPVIVEYDIEL